MATQLDQLYETDFYAWTEDQAAALRSLLQQRWNGPLDLANLAEEVEDLGKAERNAVRSQVRRIIEHCLKLEYSPASDPRSGWRVSIDDARDQIEDSLTDTIRQDVEQRLPRLYTQALRKVRETLTAEGETEAVQALPTENPYALDDLLADDWFPASRCGIVDPIRPGP